MDGSSFQKKLVTGQGRWKDIEFLLRRGLLFMAPPKSFSSSDTTLKKCNPSGQSYTHLASVSVLSAFQSFVIMYSSCQSLLGAEILYDADDTRTNSKLIACSAIALVVGILGKERSLYGMPYRQTLFLGYVPMPHEFNIS